MHVWNYTSSLFPLELINTQPKIKKKLKHWYIKELKWKRWFWPNCDALIGKLAGPNLSRWYMFIRYTVNDSKWPVVNHYICSSVGLARRSTYIVTMYFTVSVNSTGEELFTTDSQTFSGSTSSYGDVSHSSPGGDLLTTETMAVLILIVKNSLWEQVITAGLLILFWEYVNFSNGTPFYVIRKEYSLHTAQFMILGSYMVCDVLYCNPALLHMVPVVISNNIHLMSPTVSRILVTAIVSFQFSTFHIVGVLAYER